MATIKLHVYANEDDGTQSCDFRGQGELDGQHKTLLEKEFGPDVETNDEIEMIIEKGPELNKILKALFDGANPGEIVPGIVVEASGLRIGVFDE